VVARVFWMVIRMLLGCSELCLAIERCYGVARVFWIVFRMLLWGC